LHGSAAKTSLPALPRAARERRPLTG